MIPGFLLQKVLGNSDKFFCFCSHLKILSNFDTRSPRERNQFQKSFLNLKIILLWIVIVPRQRR